MLDKFRRVLRIIGIGLGMLGGVIVIAWNVLRDRRRSAYDAEAAAATDEARRVREAGTEGADDEVLDSFTRSTDSTKL